MLRPAGPGPARRRAGARGEAQRRAIAKAITLLESTRADHRARADALLDGAAAAHRQVVPPRHLRRARRRQVDLHRGARPAPDRRRAIASRCSRSTRRRTRLGRLDPRRQDAHGAALGRTRARSSGRARRSGTLGGVADDDARGDAGRRGRRLRRRDRRDRRRRPERDRGRRHDRHVRAAAAAQRRRRPAGDQEGRDGAGRPGRLSTRPTSIAGAATRAIGADRVRCAVSCRAPRRRRDWKPRGAAAERAAAPSRSRRSGRRSSASAAAQDAAARSPSGASAGARLDVGTHRRRPARALSRRRRRCATRCRRRSPRSTPAGSPASVAARALLGASPRRRHRASTRLKTREHAMHDIIQQLEAKRAQRAPRRRREAHRRAARQGQAHRARAHRAAARRRHVRGMGHVRRAPLPRLRHGRQQASRATASSPATA